MKAEEEWLVTRPAVILKEQENVDLCEDVGATEGSHSDGQVLDVKFKRF